MLYLIVMVVPPRATFAVAGGLGMGALGLAAGMFMPPFCALSGRDDAQRSTPRRVWARERRAVGRRFIDSLFGGIGRRGPVC